MREIMYLVQYCVIVGVCLTVFHITECDSQQCQSDISFTINPDADVKFTVISSLRRSSADGTCSNIFSPTAIQDIAVVQWIVDKMNAASFTRNVEIGFDVYDDCGTTQKAMSRALDVIDGPVLGTPSCSSGATCQIGIVGSSTSTATEAILYALQGSELPVLGPYASATTLTRYDNFFRTTPNDDQYIQAVLSVVKELGLTYVAMVTTDDEYGRYSSHRLSDISTQHGICVDVIQTLQFGSDVNRTSLVLQRERTKDKSLRVLYFGTRDVYRLMLSELSHHSDMHNISWLVVQWPEDTSPILDTSTDKLPNGTLVVSQTDALVSEALHFVDNKWKRVLNGSSPADPVEELMLCSGVTSTPTWEHRNLATTIDAVLVLTYAFQRQLMVICPDSTDTVCDQLRDNFEFNLAREVLLHPVRYKDMPIFIQEFVDAERVVNFTLDGNQNLDGQSPILDILLVTSQDKLSKLGVFRNDGLVIDSTILTNYSHQIAASRCGESCPVCEHSPTIPFAFLEGDTYLLGVLSLHETDHAFPFECSKFRTSQMDVITAEAFLHTVENARGSTGINYGAIILDDCYSAARMELLLTQIMSRTTVLLNPNTGEALDVDRIAAVMLSVGSSVTIPATLLMTEFNIPVISGAATSPDLDDRVNFPYFLRTVPSDVDQAKAMVAIIKEMGWKYISVLYTKNNYGSKGKDTLIQLAEEHDICVADQPEGIPDVIGESITSELKEVATRISNHKTDVVVYFGTESMITTFLQANPDSDFIYLASEDWGDRQYVLDETGQSTLGSITMRNEAFELENDGFKEYLKLANPQNIHSSRNPWFVEFWESLFNCDLPESVTNHRDNMCNDSIAFDDATIMEFVNDQRNLHMIEAVEAVTVGLTDAKTTYCRFSPVFPCPGYHTHIEGVVTQLREVEIQRDGQQVRVFKDDGNGDIGFLINNVKQGDAGLFYEEVGSYDNGRLYLERKKLNFYEKEMDGACSGNLCDHCGKDNSTTPVTMATTTHAHPVDEEFGLADYTIIGILALLLIVVFILFAIIICYLKRRITELENHLKETKYELRTGYTQHNGSSFSAINSMAINYPEMTFANNGPSGGTLYEFRKAQNALNENGNGRMPNGGISNQAFQGSNMYIHPRSEDDLEASASSGKSRSSPRRAKSSAERTSSSGTFPESPVYKPSSPSYGLSSNISFKRVDNPHNSHNSQIKKQPRTQLAVPPCRPELPPRDNEQGKLAGHKPTAFPEQFENVSQAVPKDKVRPGKSNARRTVSPPAYSYSPTKESAPGYRDSVPQSRDVAPPYREPGIDIKQTLPLNGYMYDPNRSPTDAIQLNSSMEKISRV